MKKLLLTLLILLISNIAKGIEIPSNIGEYINKPYVGMEYNYALTQDLPLLLIFASPNNITSLARLFPIAEMVYKEFKGQYNFCIINTKIEENENLIEFFSPEKLPALYIIDTNEKTYTYIPKKYYKKHEMKELLTDFKNGTLFKR